VLTVFLAGCDTVQRAFSQLLVECIVLSSNRSTCTFVLRSGHSCDVHVWVLWLAASFARGRVFAVFGFCVGVFTAKECEWSKRALSRLLSSVLCCVLSQQAHMHAPHSGAGMCQGHCA
jgi:hypothetical protein